MAAAIRSSASAERVRPEAFAKSHPLLEKSSQLAEIAGVFRGRELTRKACRSASGIAPLDALLGGGIVRGRISEIIGAAGAGKTSLAVAFTAAALRRGETVGWLDGAGSFDPAGIRAAGADPRRLLWVMPPAPEPAGERIAYRGARGGRRSTAASAMLKAAQWLLETGGFDLLVIDLGGAPATPTAARAGWPWAFAQSAALRLAHAVERGGAAVLVLAAAPMCGTFAALTLALERGRPSFSRIRADAPALFDGIAITARVTRNKLGGAGASAQWRLAIAPSSAAPDGADERPRPVSHRARRSDGRRVSAH